MTRVIVSGCCGKMGQAVSRCIDDREDMVVVAGIDLNTAKDLTYPVFTLQNPPNVEADMIIDFSHPSVTCPLLNYAVNRKLPAVIATTGLGETQLNKINEAAQSIPVFFSFNMSLGINLMLELVKKAASVLQGEFDIEIVEKHHNQKIDAPSGTAVMLADAISDTLRQKPCLVYDRHDHHQKRDPAEIGMHAVRGGTIVGEHDVIFAGRDEVFTISHRAQSKDIFAAGAVNAALFLAGKEKGLYNMQNLV